MKKLNVAIVGLSFGLEFVAIYCKHPDIDKVYVVDKNEKLLNIAKERYSIPMNAVSQICRMYWIFLKLMQFIL